jgi:hypothetical protein
MVHFYKLLMAHPNLFWCISEIAFLKLIMILRRAVMRFETRCEARLYGGIASDIIGRRAGKRVFTCAYQRVSEIAHQPINLRCHFIWFIKLHAFAAPVISSTFFSTDIQGLWPWSP